MTKLKSTIAAGLIASSAIALGAGAATSAPFHHHPRIGIGVFGLTSPVVVGGHRCWSWRHECANRWGWGTPRFDRCMWRHSC